MIRVAEAARVEPATPDSAPDLSLTREVVITAAPTEGGVIEGVVKGLPAFVFSYAHPPVGVVLKGEQTSAQHIPLDSKGRFVAEGLEPGVWTVTPYKGFSFRFLPRKVSLAAKGTKSLRIRASIEVPVTLEVKVDQSAIGDKELQPWRLRIREDPRLVGHRSHGLPKQHDRETVTVRTHVFEGPTRLTANLLLAGRPPIFPRIRATASVSITRELAATGPTPVELDFRHPGKLVHLTGQVIKATPHELSSFELIASGRDGQALRHGLRLDDEDRFGVNVAIEQIAGPQVYVRSMDSEETLGPFALSSNDLALGKLTFEKPPKWTTFSLDAAVR